MLKIARNIVSYSDFIYIQQWHTMKLMQLIRKIRHVIFWCLVEQHGYGRKWDHNVWIQHSVIRVTLIIFQYHFEYELCFWAAFLYLKIFNYFVKWVNVVNHHIAISNLVACTCCHLSIEMKQFIEIGCLLVAN